MKMASFFSPVVFEDICMGRVFILILLQDFLSKNT